MIRYVIVGLLGVVAATSAIVLAAAPARPPAACEGLPAAWVRGVTFTSWWHDSYASEASGRSFAGLAATGANATAIIATQYQSTIDANTVGADPERTPSDEALRVAIARARAAGLSVRLRLLVDVTDGGSRVQISPAEPDAWFAAYRARVVHYAALAEAAGVRTLEIGAELRDLTGPANAGRWRAIVAAARAVFGGRVTYAANWDEFGRINWWDAVDEIAIDAYFPLALAAAPSEDDVVAAWNRFVDAEGNVHWYLDEIAAVAARFDRRVVFAELGYRSARGALVAPWRAAEHYSAQEQVTGLVAALRALAARRWFAGVYLWHWSSNPDAGGPGDLDHTIQHKPAEESVRAWFTKPRPPDCPVEN